jgi:hypothetical protein
MQPELAAQHPHHLEAGPTKGNRHGHLDAAMVLLTLRCLQAAASNCHRRTGGREG